MKRMAIAGAALALVLSGCSASDPESTGGSSDSAEVDAGSQATGSQVDPAEFLAAYGLEGMSAVEAIDHLDRLPVDERPTDLMASVQPDALVLTNGVQEVSLDLPEDQSYVSIAPYLSQTHDCFYHSLTTCLGEMSQAPVDVTITDEETGEVVVEEEATTFDNGFIGFWVPEDTTGTIEITSYGKTGETTFSTNDEGATCITDLRLS